MTTSCSKAWVRGYFAYTRQQSITDNPYTLLDNFEEYSKWEDGYYEAHTDSCEGSIL